MKPSTYLQNLQLSTNWRVQYNPLRGLTIPLLVAMLEQGERGNYARLQWLYRYVEKRNSTLRAVLQRRQASMTRLDWDIRLRDADMAAFETGQTEVRMRRDHVPVATDGEVGVMRTPLRYRIRPGALRVVAPAGD